MTGRGGLACGYRLGKCGGWRVCLELLVFARQVPLGYHSFTLPAELQ